MNKASWTKGLEKAIEEGRVRVGDNFQAVGRFEFTGPGRLEIGNNVVIRPSFWDAKHYVTFSTYSPEAVIRVGNNTVLEGLRIGCKIMVDIGPDCFIGESSIMDTDFHSLDYKDRDAADKVKASPVTIEQGVRVANGCHILRGVTIGTGAVVRPMSIVSQSLPAGIVAFGFPARKDQGDS